MPYSGNPSSSAADQVRFLIGDTNNAALQLSDAEIAHLLANAGGSAAWAAPEAAEAVAAKYAHRASYSAGRTSRALAGLADALRKVAAQLRRQAAQYAVPVNTAQNRDVDTTDAANEALKQPQFSLGQFDNPEVVRPALTPLGDEEGLA